MIGHLTVTKPFLTVDGQLKASSELHGIDSEHYYMYTDIYTMNNILVWRI